MRLLQHFLHHLSALSLSRKLCLCAHLMCLDRATVNVFIYAISLSLSLSSLQSSHICCLGVAFRWRKKTAIRYTNWSHFAVTTQYARTNSFYWISIFSIVSSVSKYNTTKCYWWYMVVHMFGCICVYWHCLLFTATKINHTVPIQYVPQYVWWLRWPHAHLSTQQIERYPERCLHVPTAG